MTAYLRPVAHLNAYLDIKANIIVHLIHGTRLVKLDLSNAYHMVPVHPDDQPLLVIHWQGNKVINRALHFV